MLTGAKVKFFPHFSHALSMRSLLSVGLFERELWACDDCMTAFLLPDFDNPQMRFLAVRVGLQTWRENRNIKKVRKSFGLYACPFSLPAPVSFSWRWWEIMKQYYILFSIVEL
jgi:hypothetical protein